MSQKYTASKTRAQGRPGWAMSFRHPLRTDSHGKPGLKMRRGLGTTDSDEADRIVGDMNVLLSDSTWWTASRRPEAERRFSPVVVDAFFDEIQAGRPDTWAVRERYIALPSAADGYSRILLVGTTGAGKTTLLRHLIGSDPDHDRFPSTSTAKTTVSDIEVVLDDGDYAAVVTFFSEFMVQANVEECVADACNAAGEGAEDSKVADRLLNHRDQRFRLAYTLGGWGSAATEPEEDDWSFGDGDGAANEDEVGLDDQEQQANLAVLKQLVERIRTLALRVKGVISAEFKEEAELSAQDREALQEIYEEELSKDAEFDDLVHTIMEELRRRFESLSSGELSLHRSGWPETWQFSTGDRSEFIREIRSFSSNYAPHFGRLLTPMVDGIRVRGPLAPLFHSDLPRLVLLDGQGLGHTPDSSASVTTQITKRFADVDVILLVDNAQQPMQAAPLSVVRTVAASGHQQKLNIAFTHFDQVKGVNLPTYSAKRSHVMASVTNGLKNLREILGGTVVRGIERDIDDHCFMLGALDQPGQRLPKGVVQELERMLGQFEAAIEPPPVPEASPVYNPEGLLLAVQAATRGFQAAWAARLGLATHSTVGREHWARVKALTRRIAGELNIEYENLRPVADFIDRLAVEVSRFLNNPIRWEPRQPDELEQDAALSAIQQAVSTKLHVFTEERLVQAHLQDWRAAYNHYGRGSTFLRALEIKEIYESAAPVPDAVMTNASLEFLKEFRTQIHDAIAGAGGKLEIG